MASISHPNFQAINSSQADDRIAHALEFIARMFGEMYVKQQEVANDIAEIKNHLKSKR